MHGTKSEVFREETRFASLTVVLVGHVNHTVGNVLGNANTEVLEDIIAGVASSAVVCVWSKNSALFDFLG